MPVSSRLKLLAGMAALLGLCIAGSGCHPNLVHPAGGHPVSLQTEAIPVVASGEITTVQYAAPAVNTTDGPTLTPPPTLVPPHTTPVVRMGRPVKRPLFSAPSHTSSAPVMTPTHTPQPVPAEIANLRPVPGQGGPVPARHTNTVWGPAHRTIPEGVNVPVTTEPPLTASIAGPPILPMPQTDPLPPPTAVPMTPKKDLHQPRALISHGPRKGTGYPDLPTPGITHPVDAPREHAKRALSAYIVEPPDVLSVELSPDLQEKAMPIAGPHLVRMDGTIGLGSIGHVFVAGRTLADAKLAIAEAIYNSRRGGRDDKAKDPGPKLDDFLAGLKVDVQAYNSKFYYVIADGGGYGAQVIKVPCTGNETVLDAIAQIQGLPAVASPKKIWLARSTTGGHQPHILPVDFQSIAMLGSGSTNYQVFPGDRLFVHSDPRIRFNSHLEKFLAPLDRILGTTLLGTSVVNQIRNRGVGNNFGGLGGF